MGKPKAIAQALTCQFPVWDVGRCDSEALLQAVRFWMWESDSVSAAASSSLVGDMGERSLVIML
jgi:hypothetical protein